MTAVDALIRAPGQNGSRNVRDTTVILLTFDAAARVQEVLDLTVADIVTTPGAGRVTLTGKGRKTRVVPIMDKTGRHLDQYLNLFHPGRRDVDASLFFTIRSGRRYPMSQDNVAYLLNKHAATARAAARIPGHVHAHQLRHARAMQMLQAGCRCPTSKSSSDTRTSSPPTSTPQRTIRWFETQSRKRAAPHPNPPQSGKETTL